MSKGAMDVLAERQRQIEVEGWDREHDEQWTVNELVRAAVCYALPMLCSQDIVHWPWDVRWWKPKNRRRNLIRAAALLIAEIDRMDAAAEGPGESPAGPGVKA